MRVPETTRSEGGAEGKGDTRRFQVNAERENEAMALPRDKLGTAVQRTGVVGGVTGTMWSAVMLLQGPGLLRVLNRK